MLSQEDKIKILITICRFVRNDGYWVFKNQWIKFDPFNDLNACSRMEKLIIDTKFQNIYQNYIAEICWADHSRANNQVVFNQLTASPEQRTESFGLTLNLWN